MAAHETGDRGVGAGDRGTQVPAHDGDRAGRGTQVPAQGNGGLKPEEASANQGLQSSRAMRRLFKAVGGASQRDKNRRQTWLRALIAVVIVASVAILLRALLTPAAPPPPITSTPAAAAPQIGHYAPNVTLTDLSGHAVQVAHWRGQVVVLNFWYVACQPCQFEMPALEREYLAEQTKGVVVVGINTADDASTIENFLHQLGVTYPVVRDPDLRAVTTYKITDTPTTFILDRQGVIRYKVVGPIDHTALQQDVNTLLSAK
ncbi:MAG TPA: TlpA disulfide reductase family protein [Ktedonobacterales bacterium]